MRRRFRRCNPLKPSDATGTKNPPKPMFLALDPESETLNLANSDASGLNPTVLFATRITDNPKGLSRKALYTNPG